MQELTALLKRLQKSGKDPEVADAITALLASPADLDLQIDLVGQTHLAHWLPNRKRVLWELFDPRRPEWAHRCIERVLQSSSDMRALSALLNGDSLAVLRRVTKDSPTMVTRWDLLGSEGTVGLGFARREAPQVFRDYFYVGWKPDDVSVAVRRLDYCSRVVAPGPVLDGCLGEQECLCDNRGWAELPYRYHWSRQDTQWASPRWEPAGLTTQMLLALGYQP